MRFLNIVRKLVAILLIIGSVVVGLVSALLVDEWKEWPIAFFVVYLIVGLAPFLLGFFIMMGKELKEFIWGPVRLYTGITIGFPLTLHANTFLANISMKSDPGQSDIYLRYEGATTDLFFISIITMLIAYFYFMKIYLSWFTVSKKAYVFFAVFLVVGISTPFLTSNEYRVIREEGIFVITGEEQKEIEWSEVDTVYLNGYLANVNSSRRSTTFAWEFIFMLKNGEKIVFGEFGYSELELENSHNIKNKLIDEKIAIHTDTLTEKEWGFLEIDMKDQEEANPDDFYSLFGNTGSVPVVP